jgi:hypothetical protein
MKHVFAILLAGTVVSADASVQNYLTFQGDVAEKLFRQSRNAVGGEGAVTAVTSLTLKGTARISADDGGPPERAVEIRYLFPDQYLRIETAGTWTKRSGFSGGTLLTEIRDGAAVEKPPAPMTAALLRAEKGRLARLLLGFASMATPEVWVTLRQPPGVVELGTAFQTGATTNASNARLLQASAKDGFAALVHYDGGGIPMRVEYEANRRKVASDFADRRRVGALLLPHLITTTLDGLPLEELRISGIVINAPLTPADFAK